MNTPVNSQHIMGDLNITCPDTPRPSILNQNDGNVSPSITDHFSGTESSPAAFIDCPRFSLSPINNNDKNQPPKVSFHLNKLTVAHSTPVKGGVRPSLLDANRNKLSGQSRDSRRTSAPKCRICLDIEIGKDRLVSPCKCKGTVGLMHSSCLQQWIQVCDQQICEICKCKYAMKRRNASCCTWFSDLRSHKYFMGDLICILFLVPCTIVAVYFCVQASILMMSGATEDDVAQTRWKGAGLITLAVVLMLCLSVWISFTLRHYHRLFKEYQEFSYRWSIHNRRRTTIIAQPLTNN